MIFVIEVAISGTCITPDYCDRHGEVRVQMYTSILALIRLQLVLVGAMFHTTKYTRKAQTKDLNSAAGHWTKSPSTDDRTGEKGSRRRD